MKKNFKFIPSVNHSDVIKGDDESSDTMWKSVSENDSDLSLMVRELIQNSIDANNEQVTKVKISLKTIDLSFIDFKDLLKSIDYCIDETKKENTKGRLNGFKKEVNKGLSSQLCLVVEDESGGLNGSSRFEDCGLRTIVGENHSEKNSTALGSFGVGKHTAIRLSSFGTVFYLNQFNNVKKLIGKSILSGFTKGTRSFYGPNVFCGVETKNGEAVVADWCDFIDKDKIRTFNKDGLTTIVPVNAKKLSYENLNWIQLSILSSIKSYFKNFESGSLILTLYDDITRKEISISKIDYQDVYKKILNKISGHDISTSFKHSVLVSRPYILNEKLIDEDQIDLSIKLTNASTQKEENYKGTFVVKLFRNEELNELIESNGLPLEKTYNFRMTRGSILIRNFTLPNYERKKRLDSNLYCGLVELKDDKLTKNAKPLSELIRNLETQSHDTLDLEKLNRIFENEESLRIFRSKITHRLNRFIQSMIDKQIKEDKKNLKEIDINLDLAGNKEEGNVSNGYYREVIGFGQKNLVDQPNNSNITEHGDGKFDEDFKGTNEEGNEKVQFGGGDGKGGDNGASYGDEIDNGKEDEKGASNLIKKALQQTIIYKSKRIFKKGKKAKYVLRCNNLEGVKSITFFQDSIEGYKKSIRMFDIQSVKINGIKIPKSAISKDNKSEKINIEISDSNQKDFELEIIEPEKSITEFHLKVTK